MNYKKILIINILCWLSVSAYASQVLFDKLLPQEVAKYLNWVKAPVTPQNLCGGYYKQPEIIRKYPVAANLKTTKVTTTADKYAFYAANGDSVLEGNVIMTQPGRMMKTDKLILHRDPKTGKIISADLIGHVVLREYGKLIVGNTGYINFVDNYMIINHGLYWLSAPTATGTSSIHGRLVHAKNDDKNNILTLKDANYSTCSPDTKGWSIWTSTLELNRNTDVVTAYNPVFYIKDIPVFYFPYLHFSLSQQRKTGFLYPGFSNTSSSGITIRWPFYLNLAPNYDATITPDYMSRRGLLMDSQFRLLTTTSEAEFDVGYIYHDRKFKRFMDKYTDPNTTDPSVAKLNNDKDDRGYFIFNDTSKFNEYWSADANLNYVTDDYLLNDISSLPTTKTNDQLYNNADLKFASNHWRFLARAQAYQTLHMIGDSNVKDQYARFPQVDLTANYPNEWLGMNYRVNNEFVDFVHWPDSHSAFIPPNQQVTGGRSNIQPDVDLPIRWDGVYIDPRIQVPFTYYDLGHQPQGMPNSVTRVVPMFDVDASMAFERPIKFFGTIYTQTLEPRVMYLYVPYHSQNNIPVFDSTFPTFNFDNMFRTNRFSSIDRIGDANQIMVGLTSRFLDGNTGAEKFRADIGEIFAFRQHRVCLDKDCTIDDAYDPLLEHNISPLLGKLTYNLNPHWNAAGDIAFNVHEKNVNNGDLTFQYLSNSDHVANIGYHYQKDGDKDGRKTIDLNRLYLSTAWLFFNHWRLLGQWNYDIGAKHSFTYLYGLEYNGCCWALRGIYDKVRNTDGSYDDEYAVQIMLKGLGGFGYNEPGSLLTSSISGFQDGFSKGIL